MRRLPPLLIVIAALATCAGACSRSGDAPTAAGSVAIPLAASAPSSEAGRSATKAVIDFVAGFEGCTMSHRGVLLDLGDATMGSRMTSNRLAAPDLEVREHEGASWVSLHERTVDASFVSPVEPPTDVGIVVEARVRGGEAKNLAVSLNGKGIGALPLTRGEAKVVSIRAPAGVLLRGANELSLRATGAPRATRDNLAEIDWIRIGPADGDAPYAAPTRNDALTSVSIGGLARRGISMRSPGSARCPGFVPNGAILEGHIGVSGGEAEAEVRILVNRAEPRVVASFKLGGEGAPAWQPLSVPLGAVGTLAAVELVAKSSTKGARVVFAEPRVVASGKAAQEGQVASKGVVVVVLGSMAAKSLSPYGGPTATTELARLATAGTVFEAHRATTSFANGAVASMLTGQQPRTHGVSEPEASLGPGGVTIAEAARQAGVATAMFTANPTTSTPYGFARGWETFGARSPVEEGAATAVFDDAARWLDAHKNDRFLLVVHARGGHPPWDVTSDELKELGPAGYSGNLDARHAGELLARVRRNGASRLFGDADRERAFALHNKAVLAHDAALGKLVAHIKTIGRETDTTWIVTGDVGIDAAAHAPFLEDDTLDENALQVPLVLRGPGKPSRARVSSPTSSVDIARTTLEALGLPPPPQLGGDSLAQIALRGADAPERPRLATTTTRFSARWASFVLSGARNREGRMCNLLLEPGCASDVRATHPLATEALHALVFHELAQPRGGPPPRPTIRTIPDAATTASLHAWGVVTAGGATGK